MSRFTDLPSKLREVASFDVEQRADLGNWMAAQGRLESAALKIEALEREMERLNGPLCCGARVKENSTGQMVCEYCLTTHN
jgi:hypothetical protein